MIRVLLRKLHFFWCSLKMFDQQMIIDIGKPLANGSVAWGTSRINLGFIWLHKCFHKNFALIRRSAQKKVLTIHLVTSETKMFLSKRVSEFKHRLYAKANLHMSLYSWTRFCIGLVCGFESRYWYPMINSICRQLRYKKGLEYLKIYGFENTPNTFFAQKSSFWPKVYLWRPWRRSKRLWRSGTVFGPFNVFNKVTWICVNRRTLCLRYHLPLSGSGSI